MPDIRRQIVRLVPKPLRGALFEGARRCRISVFGIPDAYDDLRRLRSLLAPSAVLDIGAHEGETAKELGRIFPAVPVHCFEPTPETFQSLQARLASAPDVRLHRVALADRDGDATFFVNAGNQTNSLLDNDADNVRSVGSATDHLGTISVPVRRLDGWYAETGLGPGGRLVVKADVQGGERLLLEGGRRTFSENVVAFYTEVSIGSLYKGQASAQELLALLEELGFVLYQLYRTRSSGSGRALWFDAMWIHKERVPLPD